MNWNRLNLIVVCTVLSVACVAPSAETEEHRSEKAKEGAHAPGKKHCLLGLKLEAVLKSDFFDTFGMEEVARGRNDDGAPLLTFKRKGPLFRDREALVAVLDAHDRVIAFQLLMQRPFVDDRTYGGMARDIVKSLLVDGLPKDDQLEVTALIRAIDPFAPRPSDAKAFPRGYSVFIGDEKFFEQRCTHSSFTLENKKEGKSDILTITIALEAGETQTGNTVADGHSLWATDDGNLFLIAADLPEGMKLVQDNRGKGPDKKDRLFIDLGGEYGGFTVWMAPAVKTPVWRIVDLRWVFPSENAAHSYLLKSLPRLAEGMDSFPDALQIGDECHLFGPGFKLSSAPGLNAPMYSFIFRKGRVVAKFFVAQGDKSEVKLEPKFIIPLVEKIVGRISKWNPQHQTIAKVPFVTAKSDVRMKPFSPKGIAGGWTVKPKGGNEAGPTLSFSGDGHFSETQSGKPILSGTYQIDTSTNPARLNVRADNGSMFYSNCWMDESGGLRMTKLVNDEAERNNGRNLEQETSSLEVAPVQNPLAEHPPAKPKNLDWHGTYHGKPIDFLFTGDSGFTMTRADKVLRGTYLMDTSATPHKLMLIEQDGKLNQMYYRLEEDTLFLAEQGDEKFEDAITLNKKPAAR